MTLAKNFYFGLDLGEHARDVVKQDNQPSILNDIDLAFDVLTIEDGFALPSGDSFDAILLSNWLGARTRHAGILAGAPINFLEPFHVSTAIATLDYVTEGRAGLLAQSLAGTQAEAAKRATGNLNGFAANEARALQIDFDEALDVIGQLWDSWDDDAVIRDVESQRFIDGSKLRYINFKGSSFNVLGPSITPRPPQGQPVVATTVGVEDSSSRLNDIDLVILRASEADLIPLATRIRATRPELRIFADIAVGTDRALKVAIPIWAAKASHMVSKANVLSAAGVDGIRFHPQHRKDLEVLVEHILPALRDAGFANVSEGTTLRERLALPSAVNRHVVQAA